MALIEQEHVFGGRQLKKLSIGDLVAWIEWNFDSETDLVTGADKNKRFGVISDLYIEKRADRDVAMAKVIPMNTKTEKHVHEKQIFASSLKLVSKGGKTGGETNNGSISE